MEAEVLGALLALAPAAAPPAGHGHPLLFLQKMMVPLLLASWCLLKADKLVISPGTWHPFHSADGQL